MRAGAIAVAAAALGLVGAAATFVVAAPRIVVEALERWEPGVLWAIDTDRKVVALTIDDGPSDRTREILDLLEAHDARATFFLIGERVAERPTVVDRIVEAGHEIGNHTMVEESSIRMSEARFEESLSRADALLERWGDPRWFRPGSGWFDDEMLDAAEERGYRTALASMLPLDGWIPWPPLVTAYVLGSARPGAVLVLHDGPDHAETTLEVLRRVLPELSRRGFEVTTASSLAEIPAREPGSGPRGREAR